MAIGSRRIDGLILADYHLPVNALPTKVNFVVSPERINFLPLIAERIEKVRRDR